MSEPAPHGRLRTAWAAFHTPVAGVSRGTRLMAAVIPFTVLPASIWRIAGITFHLPLDGGLHPGRGQVPAWLPMEFYVLLISVLSEALALPAFGLIAGWGEVWPRWIPRLRGRPVPVLAAVIPAGLGATILTAMWSWATVTEAFGRTADWRPLPPDNPMTLHDWHSALMAAAYAPLLLWGPLLGWLTVAYWRRRAGHRPRPAATVAGVAPR
ncbi:hypothetical protein GCM10010222_15010 [Streptomyces tanashiensis]|uniref:hypothetical protein n=1 Tax=Streptomyces tanashiensis TaxID=67367 RepID=UPI0016766ABE|nr:hypothetical protein [Streptomyces tanashiensis]GGS74941.1 hypothetical protein GCM10010222_15010 [Streptomyces tanashiensis]